MKVNPLLTVLTLIFVFTLTVSAFAAPSGDETAKWEYKVLLLNERSLHGDPSGALNSLGVDGWELVAVSDTVAMAPSGTVPETFHVLYFKRKK